jgi:hypothetical protein
MKKILIVVLVTVGTSAAVLFGGSDKVLSGPLALSSVFSGLLALTGFMFTARTFITFKLNEVVYGSPNYRKYVEELKKDGAISDPLYAPLKQLDTTLGKTCLFCFGTLFGLAVFALLPKDWGAGLALHERLLPPAVGTIATPVTVLFVFYQLFTWLVYSAVLISIICVFWCIVRVNQNIKSIITHWEDLYNNPKPAEVSTEKPGTKPAA